MIGKCSVNIHERLGHKEDLRFNYYYSYYSYSEIIHTDHKKIQNVSKEFLMAHSDPRLEIFYIISEMVQMVIF